MYFLRNSVWLLSIMQMCLCERVDELIAAHVIHRHGDRNIYSSFPKDHYKSERYWPGGYGALTDIGKQQTHALGQFLRKRYDHLIGNSYSSKKVYYRSTDKSRTINSAKSCADGLYPKSDVPRIHTVPKDEDYLLYPRPKCAKFNKLLKKHLASKKLVDIWKTYRPLIRSIEDNTGKRIDSFADVADIYDTLYVEYMRGLPLPKWAYKALRYSKQLRYLVAIYFEAYTHTKRMKKLKSGYLIKKILEHFKDKTQSKIDGKLWIYSAHDITIVMLLNTLKLYDKNLPSYASSVHIELYKRGHEYYVQVLYRNSAADDHPKSLHIPKCGTRCPLDKFHKLYKGILPSKSFAKACKVR